MDYKIRDEENQSVQKKIFNEIVNACKKSSDKILSVHSRCAETDCIGILDGYTGKIILHWYSGNLRTLRDAIDLGCYFSINQQMLLSKNGRDVVDALPIDKILVESDAPFSKGLEHEYSYLFAEKVYDYLSDKRDIPRNEIPEMIKENFRAVLLDK